jgi:hypothetical protein
MEELYFQEIVINVEVIVTWPTNEKLYLKSCKTESMIVKC